MSLLGTALAVAHLVGLIVISIGAAKLGFLESFYIARVGSILACIPFVTPFIWLACKIQVPPNLWSASRLRCAAGAVKIIAGFHVSPRIHEDVAEKQAKENVDLETGPGR